MNSLLARYPLKISIYLDPVTSKGSYLPAQGHWLYIGKICESHATRGDFSSKRTRTPDAVVETATFLLLRPSDILWLLRTADIA